MNREFVSYEQALALKELGFDEHCFGHYLMKKFYLKEYHKQSEGITLRPTFSQAFRFFREKYELFHWLNDGGLIPKNQWYFTIRDKNELLPFNWVEDTTYEQAEQECLNKLIQITKEKIK